VFGCIRVARPGDAEAIRDIYAPYVRDTAISFEVTPPDLEGMHERIERTLHGFPWLVFENGEVLGYAYAGPFSSREAYRWSAEISVYVREDSHGNGIGRALCEYLLETLGRQGYAQAFAGTTLPNEASVGLFESLGFEPAGVFERAGYKLGRWHDVGWWQRSIGDTPRSPEPPTPFSALRELSSSPR
jgi:L-amino acid N-acyltransferase YncA